ncbi:SMI1/KNR4 family protein [Pseudomonas sp. NPDC090202]|uniref:SMI1/KNR4 family protein n=1 Tax=unclassified Pseudomonas TaxID=196821 RepID=UPI0037F4907C
MTLQLIKSEQNIGESDISELERAIGYSLPKEFKDFYLAGNGGVPNRDWWDSSDEYEPVRVKKFKSIAPSSAEDARDTKFVGGCYELMIEKNVIPSTLLPFATDDGGNFFCLGLVDGEVCFFATDSFDSDVDASVNHARAYRWLAASFTHFVEGLKDESDLDF